MNWFAIVMLAGFHMETSSLFLAAAKRKFYFPYKNMKIPSTGWLAGWLRLPIDEVKGNLKQLHKTESQ